MKTLIKSAIASAILAVGFSTSSLASVVISGSGALAPAGANFVTLADISVGNFVNFTEILFPGNTAEFTFTALEDLLVGPIAVSGTGSAAALGSVDFGLTFPASVKFDVISGPPSASSAAGGLPGLAMLAGEARTLFWTGPATGSVGITAYFETSAPSAVVPLPAGFPLLLGALAMLGWVRRKA